MTGWLGGALARRSPTVLLVLGLLVVGLARVLVGLSRRPRLATALLMAGLLAWAVRVHGWQAVAAVAAAVVIAAGVALASRPGVLRSWWRGRSYRRGWDDAMSGCGLVRDGIVPTLMSCRSTGGVDRLSVHMAPGQLAADWREVAPRIASALGVRSVRVRPDGPRDVLLLVRWRAVRSRAEVDPTEIAETTEQYERESQRRHEQRVAELHAAVANAPEPTEVPTGAFPRRPR